MSESKIIQIGDIPCIQIIICVDLKILADSFEHVGHQRNIFQILRILSLHTYADIMMDTTVLTV